MASMAFPPYQESPEEVAEKLAAGHDPQWIRSVVSLLDQRSPLERYVKRDRIPVVVRRTSPLTGNKSLIDLATAGKYDKVLAVVKQMFDLRRVQP